MYNTVLLFIFGLLLLIKGGDWFVDGATAIARRAHVPELLIGATVVSIGTTLPEVMVSATAAVGGQGAMAYGNAVGSIICNTALIAALTIAVRPAAVDRRALYVPVAFFFGAAAIYTVVAYAGGTFSRLVGILLLSVFAVYMGLQVISARRAMSAGTATLTEDSLPEAGEEASAEGASSILREIALLVGGAALIALGADLLVDNGTLIAEALHVPEAVIALTFVAIGTSLPELVTAVTSLAKGHGALSLGNIIGANIFNLVLVSGLSTTLSPFSIPADSTIAGINSSLLIDMPVMLAVMALMTLPALFTGKLRRWQGATLLGIYATFFAVKFIV